MTAAKKTAVVVGATSGIGQACAKRLAQSDHWKVIAVGRSRPGRDEEIVKMLKDQSASGNGQEHEFRTCDAFSLKEVKKCAEDIMDDHEKIDAVVLTQGMATTQGFTPTVDGNDEKLSLHYWSRFGMATTLLPALYKSDMTGGPVVLTVLSGGVHSAYKKYKEDPECKKKYSVTNAANIAGFYNDVGFDALARKTENKGINIFHASPGFVNTNWGTEMPWYIKGPVRALQVFGRDPMRVANIMLDPVFKSEAGKPMLKRPNGETEGIYIMDHNGLPDKLTPQHNAEARDFVWSVTKDVLGRAGINI